MRRMVLAMLSAVALNVSSAAVMSSDAGSEVVDADNHPLTPPNHPGAVLDTVTGWLWLDTTETSGRSLISVTGALGPGGEFDGWQIATREQLHQFFADAGLPISCDATIGVVISDCHWQYDPDPDVVSGLRGLLEIYAHISSFDTCDSASCPETILWNASSLSYRGWHGAQMLSLRRNGPEPRYWIGDNGTSSDGSAQPGWATALVRSSQGAIIPAACGDGTDSDGDGLVDFPNDTDCTSLQDSSEHPNCKDGVDNDGDGLVDLYDPACPTPTGTGETAPCSDHVDNDSDQLVDSSDTGCANPEDFSEASDCIDGLDNDGDGLLDHQAGASGDPGCEGAADSSEQSPLVSCDDGVDNDSDGRTDFQLFSPFSGPDYLLGGDPGCVGPADASERSLAMACDDGIDNDTDGYLDYNDHPSCSYGGDPRLYPSDAEQHGSCDDRIDNDGDAWADFPLDPGCRLISATREDPACQDGLDNDGRPGIDFDGGASVNGGVPIAASDPDCNSPSRQSESPACGLGVEITAILAWARFRRRAAVHVSV